MQRVEAARGDYVKTSTGFAPTGATDEDIRLMRASVSPRVKVNAAHGVRTLDALLDVMAAGAERCGATATARPGSSGAKTQGAWDGGIRPAWGASGALVGFGYPGAVEAGAPAHITYERRTLGASPNHPQRRRAA